MLQIRVTRSYRYNREASVIFIAVILSLSFLLPVSVYAQSKESQNQAAPPNVLVWMLDDVGFAQLSSFGGLVETPNIDRVAQMGLRYTNYHTAPICSAARASFLTGRNPHSVHIGGHAASAFPAPGYDALVPRNAGTIAANLQQAGYLTLALGKWDHLPSAHTSPAGPFTYWPLGQGFERFYGFLAADNDNWTPTLISGTEPVKTPAQENYHLSADMADQAIAMIDSRYSQRERRPFFMYWATGIAHSPHHAPKAWIEHYKGKFDMGWDKAREIILEKQKNMGVMPQEAKLAERPEGMPEWEKLNADEKRLFSRQMEVFAASLSYTDAQFGRIIDSLEASGELDNTIVIITSDNGASAEGGPAGLYNEASVVAKQPKVQDNLRFYDSWGGPETYPHYAYGWAVAGDTPLRYFKQTTHEGGTRVPLIIAWPKSISAKGELREQFVHVTDIAPTILDGAGVGLANIINNHEQVPMEGESIATSFNDAKAPVGMRPQYTELYGNRGLWWDGWSIVTSHRFKTWEFASNPDFDHPWELYNLRVDPGQTNDLSAIYPKRVEEMSAEFFAQGERYNVFPQRNLGDAVPATAAKAQQDFKKRGGKWFYPGPARIVPPNIAPPVNFLDFTLTADVQLSTKDVTGPIFAYGGQLGGIGLYVHQGKPAFFLNSLAGDINAIVGKKRLGTLPIRLKLEFKKLSSPEEQPSRYQVTVRVDDKTVLDDEIAMTVPSYFGLSETFNVGFDEGSPVDSTFAPGEAFPGKLRNIMFDFSGSSSKGLWQVH